jgi:hypothetical protein
MGKKEAQIIPNNNHHYHHHSIKGSLSHLVTNQRAYPMGENASWKADNCSTGQEIPPLLWNLKIHYSVHNSLPLLSSHLHLSLPNDFFPSGFSINICMNISYIPKHATECILNDS